MGDYKREYGGYIGFRVKGLGFRCRVSVHRGYMGVVI